METEAVGRLLRKKLRRRLLRLTNRQSPKSQILKANDAGRLAELTLARRQKMACRSIGFNQWCPRYLGTFYETFR
jgi:hypothetical protein